MSVGRRIKTALTVLALAAVSFTACSSEPAWHPVTTEESQILGITRFNNFDTGSRPFTTEVTVEGSELALRGWIDFGHHVGYASVTGEGFAPQRLLWWDDVVALGPGDPDAQGYPALPLPVPSVDDGWQIRPYSPDMSQLDAVLSLVGALGVDRPENPLLLQQAGALWLGEETIDSADGTVEVDIFSTPPSEQALGPDDPAPTPEDAVVKLWVDESGLLHRTEALLGSDWVTINFGTEDSPEFTPDSLPAVE